MRERLTGPLGLGLAAALAAVVAFRDLWLLRPVRDMHDPVEAWFFQTNETAPQFVYAVFLLFLWLRRDRIRAGWAAPGNPAAGGFFLALSGLLFAWSRVVAQIDLQYDALALLAIGAALWLGGGRLLSAVGLPLVFLYLARPLPPMLTHQLHHAMQMATAAVAYEVLDVIRSPVFRSGDLLEFHGRTFEVIETCSGVRIVRTLVMTSLLFAEVFSRTRLQRWAVIGLAPFVGFGVNAVRVVTLVLNPFGEIGTLHSLQGMVMIFAGVLLLGVVDVVAGRLSRQDVPEASDPPPPAAEPSAGRVGLVAALALVLAVISFVPLAVEPEPSELWRVRKLARDLDGWTADNLPRDDDFWGSVVFARELHREYRRGRDRIDVFLAVDDRRRRDLSGLSPKTHLPGAGWELRKRESVPPEKLGLAAERVVVGRERPSLLTYHFRIGASGTLAESLRWMLAADSAPGAPPRQIVTVRIGAPIGYGGEAYAEGLIDSFLGPFLPALVELAPASERPSLPPMWSAPE